MRERERKVFFGLRLRCLRALVFAERPTLKHHLPHVSLTRTLYNLPDLYAIFRKSARREALSVALFLPLLCFYFMILVIQRHLCFISALSISFLRLKALRRVVFRRGRLLFHLFLAVVNKEKMCDLRSCRELLKIMREERVRRRGGREKETVPYFRSANRQTVSHILARV